jgi:hypothetical protein
MVGYQGLDEDCDVNRSQEKNSGKNNGDASG